MAVAPWMVSDELWELVEPLLPVKKRRFRHPGRRRLPEREALQGILFVLHTGISWTHLPAELGFGSAVTCWRRLDEWQSAGVWERLHELPLARLRAAGEIEWSRAVADASQVQAKKGAPRRARARLIEPEQAPNTTSSSKAAGIPLAWRLTGGNRHDSTQLIALVDRVPPLRGKVGRPRRRPKRVTADRGYDYDSRRRELRQRGITAEIARRNTEHGSGLGHYRWVVERTFAWLHQLKRLLVRYDRRGDIHEAFLALGCCLVCYRRLRNTSL
jgi:transposase